MKYKYWKMETSLFYEPMKRKGGPGFKESKRPLQFVRTGGQFRPRTRVIPTTRGEMKYFDCELTNSGLTEVATDWTGTEFDPSTTINLGSAAVATPLCLCAPTVGAALNQRIGRKINVHKIKVRGQVTLGTFTAQSAARTATVCRVVLVQDMQTNATQMQGEQLFNAGGVTETTLNSFQNPNNFGRFRILKEKFIVVQDPNMAGEVAAANLTANGKRFHFKMNVRFRIPVQVNFNATNGGTVADIVDNSFHIIAAMIDSTQTSVGLSYYSRVCYKE